MDENLKKIKEIILQTAKEMNIEIDKIILFGSRARGDYREDSDYDLLIVTKEKLDRKDKIRFKTKMRIIFAKEKIPVDLIVYSSQEFEERAKDVSYIAYYASKEGVLI
ncbi:MAG: nucleotidyltransferase domain-containing protein [Candidatus Aenigmatarchaeota archaeon]